MLPFRGAAFLDYHPDLYYTRGSDRQASKEKCHDYSSDDNESV